MAERSMTSDIEKIAMSIEADVGEPLPDLRRALAEAKACIGRVTTLEQISKLNVHVGTARDMGRRFSAAFERAMAGEDFEERHVTFASLRLANYCRIRLACGSRRCGRGNSMRGIPR